MKDLLRKLFSPVLNPLEAGNADYDYRPSHRKILIAMGALFIFLSVIALIATVYAGQWGGVLPVAVFLLVGLLCEVVAFLGSDRAVAKLWKSK